MIFPEFADWLLPMLTYDPAERASALECINHPFLADVKEQTSEPSLPVDKTI